MKKLLLLFIILNLNIKSHSKQIQLTLEKLILMGNYTKMVNQ